MSKLETNQVDPATGTTLTLGTSGDTISIPSGVTIANSGTATGFGGANTPIVSVDMTGSDPTISSGAYTKIQMNTERVDTDNAFDNSTNYTFTVPSGKAGKYFMIGFARISALNGTSDFAVLQLANSDRSTTYNSNVQSGNSGYGFAAITVSCARDLSVGDTVSLFAYGSEEINIADGNCNLTVYKLIE
jgi:hypothetical protein